MEVILGIDTSCYTTSAALVDAASGECVDYKLQMLLPQKNEKGLRQSTALFLHVKNLPNVISELMNGGEYSIKAVCVSQKPRPVEDSYMPVFEAGVCVASSVASALGVPLYTTTHQENHIMAASNGRFTEPFIALHLSGGTTELTLATPNSTGFDIELLSATQDISFGKLIDRMGVDMGLDFPAGKHLEAIANGKAERFVPPIKLYNANVSLSGAEKQFIDALANYPKEGIAYGLFEYSGKLLEKWVSHWVEKTGIKTVLFAGGVASNKIIKNILQSSQKLKGTELCFAEPELCKDNAVGTAKIGQKFYMENKQ